jgi:hypothetical protein
MTAAAMIHRTKWLVHAGHGDNKISRCGAATGADEDPQMAIFIAAQCHYGDNNASKAKTGVGVCG